MWATHPTSQHYSALLSTSYERMNEEWNEVLEPREDEHQRKHPQHKGRRLKPALQSRPSNINPEWQRFIWWLNFGSQFPEHGGSWLLKRFWSRSNGPRHFSAVGLHVHVHVHSSQSVCCSVGVSIKCRQGQILMHCTNSNLPLREKNSKYCTTTVQILWRWKIEQTSNHPKC